MILKQLLEYLDMKHLSRLVNCTFNGFRSILNQHDIQDAALYSSLINYYKLPSTTQKLMVFSQYSPQEAEKISTDCVKGFRKKRRKLMNRVKARRAKMTH